MVAFAQGSGRMGSWRRRLALAGLCAPCLLGLGVARGQELTLFGGSSASQGIRANSYSWLIDYRQGILGRFDASLSWINEGHFTSDNVIHHRDGLALETWYNAPIGAQDFGLSLGFGGVDYFFDSQELNGQSLDIHRFTPVASADLKYSWDPLQPWFLQLRATELFPFRDPEHLLVDFGAGYYFGPLETEHIGQLPSWNSANAATVDSDRFDLTVYKGVARVNTFARLDGSSYAADVRWSETAHFDWSAGYLYEGYSSTLRRSGLTGEGWIMSSGTPEGARWQAGIGLGFGAYANIDARKPSPSGNAAPVPFLAGLVSPTVYIKMPANLVLRLVWDRVVTSYNKDADLWLGGLGYRF
jgi:hypothetical protein